MTATQDALYPQLDTLAAQIAALAANCDGARERDGQGFDGMDAPAGRRLAAVPAAEWTGHMVRLAWEFTRKYARQLREAGYEPDELAVPVGGFAASGRADARKADRRHRALASRRVELSADRSSLVVAFAYDPDLVDAVKTIPGRRFDPSTRTWHVPIKQAAAVLAFAEQHRFALGDDVDGIEAPPPPPFVVNISHARGVYRLAFDYRSDVVAAVRQIPTARWNAHRSVWEISDAYTDELRDTLDQLGVETRWDDSARELLAEAARADELRALSHALDAPGVNVPGLGVELRNFQKAAVLYSSLTRRTIIGDEMGSGKTIEALAAIANERAYPAIIVCPAVVRLNWRDEALRALPGRTVHVISGSKPDLVAQAADVVVLGYDVLHGHTDTLPAPAALVFDESHYLKTPGRFLTADEHRQAQADAALNGDNPAKVKDYTGARRTAAAHRLADRVRDHALVLLLSGTPTKNGRPKEIGSQLAVMSQLDAFGGYAALQRLGGDGDALNRALRGRCMIRRTKDEILPELPPKQRSRVPVEMDPASRREYEQAERDVLRYLAEQARKLAEELGEDPESAAVEARMRASGAEHLIVIGVLRKLAARGKLKAAREWITGFRDESGRSLVTFAHHREVTTSLASELGARSVIGGISDEARHEAVARFQQHLDPVLVCSISAAGVGITLTAASDVLFIEQAWTPADHDQAEDRCHRIGQDASSVDAHYLIASRPAGEPTIDEDMWELIEDKRAEVARLVDGVADDDMSPAAVEARRKAQARAGESVAGDLVARLTRRAVG